jgi:hypothetical protein
MMKNHKISLGKIIRSYKARTCRMIRVSGFDSFEWQRSYYDHVVRDERSLNRIREYIRRNPEQWASDKKNPLFQSGDKFNRWLNKQGKQTIIHQKVL